MSSGSNMAAIYSELAPQFLAFLEGERTKIEKQVERLKQADSAGGSETDDPETDLSEKGE